MIAALEREREAEAEELAELHQGLEALDLGKPTRLGSS